MSRIVIACNKPYYESIKFLLEVKYPNTDIYNITDSIELTSSVLDKIKPEYIFFPHWSEIIPEEIHGNYNCVIFHMTDVPYGRGGSPLQNLISRGIYETKISAIQCVKELDAGPVYLKESLSLHGNAEEIYMRAALVIEKMISTIIENNTKPEGQTGNVVEFKRRKPHQGNIADLDKLEHVFDYIRMLDAEGYPKAFIEVGNFVFEFERASLKQGEVHADVKIKLRKEDK